MAAKSIGDAATEDERALESAVQRVPHWRALKPCYRPVSGGITNSNWRVDVGGDRFFVKIPGRGTDMFINRAVAFDASRKAYELGIGPAIYDWLAEDGIEIATFIDDRRTAGLGDFQDIDICNAVIDAYKIFHRAAPLPQTKTVFDMIDEHVEQVATLKAWRPHDVEWLHDEVAKARAAMFASGLDLVPCFNDPMPGNFLIGADKSMMLIDYEYASNNDRAYDLGAWFGEMFIAPDQEAALVERYCGATTPAMLARARIYKAMADMKWATWSMVQERVSTLAFDFRKYGVWKYMRARDVMLNPHWNDWLRTVEYQSPEPTIDAKWDKGGL